jgi:Zn-dependent protease
VSSSYTPYPRVGRPRAAFRPSALFLCLVALFATSAVLAYDEVGNAGVNVLLFVVSGWLVSLCLHEYAHALTAFRSGDLSVADKGYLRLDLLKYAHPVLSIALPVFFILIGGFALPGGAVWVDHTHIRGRWRYTAISLAGPLTNVVFMLALAAPFWFGVTGAAHTQFWSAVALLGFFQLTAALLNLLPVPGLDGGNALRSWLTGPGRRAFDAVAPFGMLLFFALIFNPRLGGLFFDAVNSLAQAVGIPLDLKDNGFRLLQFWQR